MLDLVPYRNRRVRILTDRGVTVTGELLAWAAHGRPSRMHLVDDTDTDRYVPRHEVLEIDLA